MMSYSFEHILTKPDLRLIRTQHWFTIIGIFCPLSLKKQCVKDFFSDTLPMLLAKYRPSLDFEEECHVPAIGNS